MTRHSKNATGSSVYGVHERKKDSKQGGYGTLKERLSGDSVKPFDCCCLSLQPCKDAMITPDGYIFDKESILSYIVEQKKAQKRQMKAYEKYLEMEEAKKKMAETAEFDEKKRKFFALESTPAHTFMAQKIVDKRRFESTEYSEEPVAKKSRDEDEKATSKTAGAKDYRSFWVPELSTTAEPDKVEKPSGKVLNPMNGKPLKFKDLMPVVFTPVDANEASTSRIHSMKDRYKCPITGDILTNSCRAAYLKTSQRVVSWRCVENIIRKDMVDPINNEKLEESDIIELQRGGTGFAATNQVEAKVVKPNIQLS